MATVHAESMISWLQERIGKLIFFMLFAIAFPEKSLGVQKIGLSRTATISTGVA